MLDTFEGHGAPITGVSAHYGQGTLDFSHLFLTASMDWTVKLWSLKVNCYNEHVLAGPEVNGAPWSYLISSNNNYRKIDGLFTLLNQMTIMCMMLLGVLRILLSLQLLMERVGWTYGTLTMTLRFLQLPFL